MPFAFGRPGFCGSGGRLTPSPPFDASAGSSPTRGTGLPGGRSRGELAAPPSTVAALPAIDAFAAASPPAIGALGVGTAASFDCVAPFGSVEVVAGGSGVSTMIGASDPRFASVTGAVPMSFGAGAEALPAGARATAVSRGENCHAATAAMTTNKPLPATTSQLFARRRAGATFAFAASGAGRESGAARAAGRLGGPPLAGGNGGGRDAAHAAACDGGPSRPCDARVGGVAESGAGAESAPARADGALASAAGTEAGPVRGGDIGALDPAVSA